MDYRYHSNVLFKELRILKLFDSTELKTAMLMYKANKKMLPLKLWNLLKMDLRNSTTLPRFKKEYKNSLLRNYDLSN